MHQLKCLLWQAYKMRLRSPLATAFDSGGPILITIIYLLLKLTLSSLSLDAELDSKTLFRNVAGGQLDPRSGLQRHLCTRVLFYSPAGATSSLARAVGQQCGLELIPATSRDNLLTRLASSLEERVAYRKEGTNLARGNSTISPGGCFTLPGAKEPFYQLGIVILDEQITTFELHLTDLATNPVIYQPYVQGSTYNEYRTPHSDLNSGLHLLQICLANAFSATVARSGETDIYYDNIAINYQASDTVPPTNQTTPSPVQAINTTTSPSNININPAAISPGQALKMRLKSYPTVTSTLIVPILFLVFNLASYFCNAITTVMRISENNETGLHHYIRASGVPAGVYWLSQIVAIMIHMALQSLILSILLAIPTSSILVDPIQEINIALRWLLLFSYSFSINAHAMFIASLFERTSHALLVTCLLAVSYCTYPLLFQVQWTPYSFSSYGLLAHLVLLNPVSNYEALLLVLFGIYIQTGLPLNWNQLSMALLGGGVCDWSIGTLWALLIIQGLFWLVLTILVDQLCYSSSRASLALATSLGNELFCCNVFQPVVNDIPATSKTKSSLASKSAFKKLPDPNRICCSMRHISVVGPAIMMAHARGNPLMMDDKQLDKLRSSGAAGATGYNLEEGEKSVATKYVVNRNASDHNSSQYRAGSPLNEPILIDEAMLQHIVWQQTKIALENLSLDFRFNQVSFILGQTDVKELFFNVLMGLRTLHSGYIVLDGTIYTAATLNLARSQVGFLGERDIFLNELTIFENLQFFGSLRDKSYAQYDSESLFILNLLHLSRRKDDFPSSLTSRSARKLAVGVAAVGHTKILLLVEPTLGLRWKPRCQVLNLLKKYKSIRSIVVDTSDVDEASAFGDRIVLLKNGRVDLDGTPDRLRKKLDCGYWLVFEPIITGDSKVSTTAVNNDIKALEKLTFDIFKDDKLGTIDFTTRSVYQHVIGSDVSKVTGVASGVAQKVGSNESKAAKTPGFKSPLKKVHFEDDNLHKSTALLKVQHSTSSCHSLCTLLKMFSHHNSLHGFRLTELTYESLEDELVLRMSKGIYPDLPPDLLLSLQHRTRAGKSNQQVSVRKCESDFQVPKVAKPMFGARFLSILKDRTSKKWELVMILVTLLASLTIVCLAMVALQISLNFDHRDPELYAGSSYQSYQSSDQPVTSNSNNNEFIIEHDWLKSLYENRIGFYVMIDKQDDSASAEAFLDRWAHNKRLTGVIKRDSNQSDSEIVVSFVLKSRDLAVSLVVFDLKTGDTTLIFEANLVHAMSASIKTFIDYHLNMKRTPFARMVPNYKTSQSQYRIKQVHTHQPWHGIISGYQNRRFFYGIGFALAESIAIGIMVVAPIRHRSESREIKLRVNYWIAMALFDLAISLLLIIGYLSLIMIFEWTHSITSLAGIFMVLVLYKLGAIPFAYLVALLVESSLNGFMFILLAFMTVSWVFSIHLKTFIEWVIYGQGYLYTIANWIIIASPINAVIDSLTNVNYLHHVNELCKQIPAYTAASNLVPLEGQQRGTMADKLVSKFEECLASGKEGVSVDVMHQRTFGILWDFYMIIVFDIIVWTFLLFSERVFGLLAKRFTSNRTSLDPLKSIVRSSSDIPIYKWDREKDRLVSDYVRCMNEAKYVKQMVANCIYLRIWIKPMSDEMAMSKRIVKILEPLIALGQPRHEIQVELETTLQIFIKIGNETSRCKIDRIQLIEAYAKFANKHEDSIAKFAVVDWTRETLYKILLHGHYNTKCALNIT